MSRVGGPSEAEWQRLTVAFGMFFAATLIVAILFASVSPLPPVVELMILVPPVGITGWIWIFVVLRRDAEKLGRLTDFAARRRGRRGRRRRR